MLDMNSSMKLISENWLILGLDSLNNWFSYLAQVPKSRRTFLYLFNLLLHRLF